MNAKLQILKNDVSAQIENLSTRRRGNKKKAEYVVLASAAISAGTTVSIGLSSLINSWSTGLQSLALILSASLSVLTAWDSLYNHKRLWLLQAELVNKLTIIQTDIKHIESQSNPPQEYVNELYEKYRAAFDEFNGQWIGLRTDNNIQPENTKHTP